jgi:hypothetical protein
VTMVTITRIDRDTLLVLPPCRRCREVIRRLDPANLGCEVVLGLDESTLLRDLLPPERTSPDKRGTDKWFVYTLIADKPVREFKRRSEH